MNVKRWITHFTDNRCAFREPDWKALGSHGGTLRDDPRRALLIRSLATFQLGESGGGTRLLRFVKRETGNSSDYEKAVRLFVAEEQYHAELLAYLVHYLDGKLLEKHWLNRVFRGVRSMVNLQFNVQVLLTAELIAEAYYGLLYRRIDDPTIHRVSGKILADEVHHIAFHCDFFRTRNRTQLPVVSNLWSLQFQAVFLATERAVWAGHGRCLSAFGINRREFSVAARACCRRFLERVLTPRRQFCDTEIMDLPAQTEQG